MGYYWQNDRLHVLDPLATGLLVRAARNDASPERTIRRALLAFGEQLRAMGDESKAAIRDDEGRWWVEGVEGHPDVRWCSPETPLDDGRRLRWVEKGEPLFAALRATTYAVAILRGDSEDAKLTLEDLKAALSIVGSLYRRPVDTLLAVDGCGWDGPVVEAAANLPQRLPRGVCAMCGKPASSDRRETILN